MASPFRNLKKGIRRLFNVQTVTLDGVTASTDPSLVGKLVRNGLFKETYEEPERILVRETLHHDDRVLEIGGGIGFVSILCAKICGDTNILIYEANPRMVTVIEKNFKLNGLTPQLRCKGITPDGRDATFFVSDNILSSSLYKRNGTSAQKVPADAIDQVIAEWQPNALVMDAEGAEVDILGGSTLVGLTKLIIEFHPHIVGEERIQQLKKHLAGLGFEEGRSILNTVGFHRRVGCERSRK